MDKKNYYPKFIFLLLFSFFIFFSHQSVAQVTPNFKATPPINACMSTCMKDCRKNPSPCIGTVNDAGSIKQKNMHKFCQRRCVGSPILM